jgi:hypothetical protein
MLYCFVGWADSYVTADTLEKALEKLPPAEDLDEVQFWCHGWAGLIAWSDRTHTQRSFSKPLTRPGGLIWFRSCGTMAGIVGRNFVKAVAEQCQCKVAAHTHLIGQWGLQSGLRIYDPQKPAWDWPLEEGIIVGPLEGPQKLEASGPFRPSTVTALTSDIPKKIGGSFGF